MAHRLSKSNQMSVADDGEKITHKSVAKSAVNSFTEQLAKRAQDLKSKGASAKEVAAAMKLDNSTVENLLEMKVAKPKDRNQRQAEIDTKPECACKNGADPEKEAHLSAAEEAYNTLHGRKKADVQNQKFTSDKTVLKSRKGDIVEAGGPKKYMGSETSNSIWDPEVVERASKTKDNGERIREEKAAIAKQQAERKQAEMQINTDALKDLMNDVKAKRAASGSEQQVPGSWSKRIPQSGMSIFDNGDFSKIPEKTTGEKLAEQKAAEAASRDQDRSWADNRKALKSSDILNRMIDSMLVEKPADNKRSDHA